MNRRTFLVQASTGLFALANPRMLEILAATDVALSPESNLSERKGTSDSDATLITMFLCGDVMTGRGIDQVLPHPGDPLLFESYIRSAAGYVELAELANGPIRKPVDYSYIWGDSFEVFARQMPHVRIVNLETSVTTSDDAWPNKPVQYPAQS